MQNPLLKSMISKAITLLTLIGRAKRPLTFSDLVEKSGLSKSTVHRILANLMDEEMVQLNERMKVYLLGPRAFDMMTHAYGGYDLQALAVDGMMELRHATGRNVSVAVVDGDNAMVLRAFDATDGFGGHSRPGMREPLHVCAAGKALVAYLPPPLFEAKFEQYEFFARAPNTITTLDGFRADLEAVRNRGYATCDREEYDYIVGIAAPIFNYVGEVIGTVNLWGTTAETNLTSLEAHAGALVDMTSAVTKLIGGRQS